MKLYEIAHSRAGDKGNIVNLSLIPFKEKDYDYLYHNVTAAVVKEHLKDIVEGEVVRYELANIRAFNFVCYDSLLGGVTTSLALDAHGKCLSSALLELEVEK
ncbi:hypothetical protein DFR56_1015 [Pseudogracilibacillus auburnensis]|uniref:AtuA-like ferredoxin-fold domain-containing protein n=1 Tax=Pseudogracilibacillus auburnensis TaxID=1494959 RepID=A0A2V3W708_9BACI|nr:hypothetical protein DFR56_1015 [Pseudogracilibacillus auburnensis]